MLYRSIRSACFIMMSFIFAFSSQAGAVKSSGDAQTAVEVTVYNDNVGLVKDARKITLPPGESEVRFMDVASGIMPETVYIKDAGGAEGVNMLEQNYEYDLMSADRLLDKYVGKNIKIADFNEFQGKKEVVDAELLSNNDGQIYKINGEIYLGHPGYRVLPQVPEDLISKPTLVWLCETKTAGEKALEVSYLTQGITWRSDYIVALDDKDEKCDLTGWVTVDNNSGAKYKNSKLKLVAGNVKRARQEYMVAMDTSMAMAAKAAPAFQEETFFEYHIYDLQRKTTLKDRQMKQIMLLDAPGVKVAKELIVYGTGDFYGQTLPGDKQKLPVQVTIKLKNSKENGLGMPLPAGIMRLYKKDSSGSLQFAGEDRISHTPENEEVKLNVGEAFDVVAESSVADFKPVGKSAYDTAREITVRNHKKSEVSVSLIESIPGSWEMLEKSHPFVKVDAVTIKFSLKVPKDGEVTVRYKVRVKM